MNGPMSWVFGYLQGALTIAAGGVLNIVKDNIHDMPSCTLTNYGTVAWSGGLVRGGAVCGDDPPAPHASWHVSPGSRAAERLASG